MFTDVSYFVGEISIPNTEQQNVADRISIFINEREPEFLKTALGYPLYKVFATGILVTPTPDQRYTDILYGADYTGTDGLLKQWKGFVKPSVAESIPYSVIANYIYYWYNRAGATQSMGIGEIKFNPDGSIIDNPNQKMKSAWNKMSERIYEFINFMDVKCYNTPSIYPEFTWTHRNAALCEFGPITF